MSFEYFDLTEDHVKLVKHFWVSWQPDEYGAPEIDPKKPYGNSDVERDIAEILGWTPEAEDWGDPALSEDQRNDAHRLHKETAKALQVILRAGSFVPGRYQSEQYHRNWTLVEIPVAPGFSVGNLVKTTDAWETRWIGPGYTGVIERIDPEGSPVNKSRTVLVHLDKECGPFQKVWFDPKDLELNAA